MNCQQQDIIKKVYLHLIHHQHRYNQIKHSMGFFQLFNEHLKGSTIMQTPATPNSDITGLNKVTRNNKENDDEQHFYSTPSSRMFT